MAGSARSPKLKIVLGRVKNQPPTLRVLMSGVFIQEPMSIPDPESAPEASLIRALSSRFEIDSTEESRLEIACRAQRVPTDNGSHTTPAEVGFSAVSTLVCRGKGEISGIGYVVPTFAVHWGVIVRETLFHLRYDSRNKAVQFDWRAWRAKEGNPKHKVDVVGQTQCSTDELIETGLCIPERG